MEKANFPILLWAHLFPLDPKEKQSTKSIARKWKFAIFTCQKNIVKTCKFYRKFKKS